MPQSTKWQEAAAQLMVRAQQDLWKPEGTAARDYLYGQFWKRDTVFIELSGFFGYNPTPQQFPFEQWGIDPVQLPENQRKKGGVNIPDGILIPWFVNGKICKLTVVRPDKSPNYGQILGSQDCLFNGDAIAYGKPALMVESEFDAMRMHQEAGDLVTCVATGSAKGGRSARALCQLSLASFVLQCFESDEAAIYWTERLQNCMRWTTPVEMRDEWVGPALYSGMIEVGLLCALHAPDSTLARAQQGVISSTQTKFPISTEKHPKSQGSRVLSTDEIIGQFRDEIVQFWGSCTVEESSSGLTLAKHMKLQGPRFYWGASHR